MTPTTKDSVRPATVGDIPYIEALTNRFSREVGFIPRVALERRITGGRGGYVAICTENEEPAGFIHAGSFRRPEARIFQAAIQYDAQRRHLGEALVNDYLDAAREKDVKLVTLRCLSDIEANAFWRSMGFRDVAREPVSGKKNRGRHLIVWARRLHTMRDLLTPGFIPPAVPMRGRSCRQCGRPCTYTRGTRGELWRLCGSCVRGVHHAA